MNGYGGQEIIETLREERRADMAQMRSELAVSIEEAVTECGSVRREVQKVQSLLDTVNEALENKTTKAMRDFESVGAAAKADAALLRREMAEVAAALEIRISKLVETAALEKEARDAVVRHLETRLDAIDNDGMIMNVSIGALSKALVNQSQYLQLSIQAAEKRANSSAFEVAMTQRKAIEDLVRANDTAIEIRFEQKSSEILVNVSNANLELKMNHVNLEERFENASTKLLDQINTIQNEFFNFRDEALKWTQSTENDLTWIASNLTKLDNDAFDFQQKQNENINATQAKLDTLRSTLNTSMHQLVRDESIKFNERFQVVSNISYALNSSILEIETSLKENFNYTQIELENMRNASSEFSAIASSWSTMTEDRIREIAVEIAVLETKIKEKEKEVQVNLSALHLELSSMLDIEVNERKGSLRTLEIDLNMTNTKLDLEKNHSQSEIKKLQSLIFQSIDKHDAAQSLALATAIKKLEMNISTMSAILTSTATDLTNTSEVHAHHIKHLLKAIDESNSTNAATLLEIKANTTALADQIIQVENSAFENLASFEKTWQNVSSSYAEKAHLWSQDVQNRLEAHSTAILALEFAANATAAAVDAEVSARRRDSARSSNDVDRLNTSAIEMKQAISSLNSTTAKRFNVLDGTVVSLSDNTSTIFSSLREKLDFFLTNTNKEMKTIETRFAGLDTQLEVIDTALQVTAKNASAWASSVEHLLSSAYDDELKNRYGVSNNFSRLEIALLEVRTESRDALLKYESHFLRLLDDFKERLQVLDKAKSDISAVISLSSRLDAAFDTTLSKTIAEDMLRQVDQRPKSLRELYQCYTDLLRKCC